MVCWSLFVLFAVLDLLWQFVDVKPYPNEHRDWLIGTVVLTGGAAMFFVLALIATKAQHRT